MIETVRITKVKDESKDAKTIEFRTKMRARPGQFMMVWTPGMDEVPMSFSSVGAVSAVTVKAVGDSTKALHKLKENDLMMVRGPFGSGFSVKGKNILIVGGGIGMAGVMSLIRETKADTIIGARSADEIVMENEAKKYSENVWVSTDDGTRGFHGNAVALMKEKVAEKKYDLIAACGPEIMLYYLHNACVELNTECQLSLERYMKCGAGICGACTVDDMRVCADGPVFTCKQVTKLKEMGKFRRDPSGSKIKIT